MLHRLRASISHVTDRRRLPQLLVRCEHRVHLGCNDVRLEGYVNVDVRRTKATDIVHDCRDVSVFPNGSLAVVYSNAFFEHLYVTQREAFLSDVHRALRPDGWLILTGLPDFAGVARAYLERRQPGNVSPVFDLYEAYRYTHGAPEGQPSWWTEQLHKGLLDVPTMVGLLQRTGFGAAEVFVYGWGQEAQRVTFGCIATKAAANRKSSRDEGMRSLLTALPANINWATHSVDACYPPA